MIPTLAPSREQVWCPQHLRLERATIDREHGSQHPDWAPIGELQIVIASASLTCGHNMSVVTLREAREMSRSQPAERDRWRSLR